MPRLTFEISVPASTPPDARIVIAGTDIALGHWQPERGLELERGEDGKYRGACDLPAGLVEFKVTRGSWKTEEAGPDDLPVLNYHYLIAHDLDLTIEVEHWKDLPPIDPELIHGRAIDVELTATQLGHSRHVAVWLPPAYLRSADSRHPVLYLFDGQDSISVFSSPENETIAADECARRLAQRGLIPEPIIVAVFHRSDFGERDTELSPRCDGPKMADFLVHDLKPFIDWTFCRDRVHREPAHTAILGFGLGGALALWMATAHTDTFGRFGCLSPYYPDLSGDRPGECELIHSIKASKTIVPGDARIYMDHGTLGTDAAIATYQARTNAALLSKKLVEGRDFTVNVAVGAEHTLTAWRARLGAALSFLLGPGPAGGE